MNLAGSLDVFSLPEILQLLATTKKSGALHLDRGAEHGVVRLADGSIAAASGDTSRQSLVRRLVGAGHLTDTALADGVERVRADPGAGLARAVADAGDIDAPILLAVAHEHTLDALFDLLRWPDGDFTFRAGEVDRDDVGQRLPADELVAAAEQRIAEWPALSGQISSPDVVLCLAPAPADDPTLTRAEWSLLALVDGRRTVRELTALCGRGEYAVVAVLSPLLERGLLMVAGAGDGDVVATLVRRQQLIAGLETAAAPAIAAPALAAPAAPVPAVSALAADPPTADPPTADPPAPAPRAVPIPAVAPLLSFRGAGAPATHAVPAPLTTPPAPVDAPAADLTTMLLPPREIAQGSAPHTTDSAARDRDERVDRSMVLRLIAGVQQH